MENVQIVSGQHQLIAKTKRLNIAKPSPLGAKWKDGEFRAKRRLDQLHKAKDTSCTSH